MELEELSTGVSAVRHVHASQVSLYFLCLVYILDRILPGRSFVFCDR